MQNSTQLFTQINECKYSYSKFYGTSPYDFTQERNKAFGGDSFVQPKDFKEKCALIKNIAEKYNINIEINDLQTLITPGDKNHLNSEIGELLFKSIICSDIYAVTLLAPHVELNETWNNHNNVSPLNAAIASYDKEIVNTLIRNGAKVNYKDGNNNTPLDIVHDTYKDMLHLIAEKGGEFSKPTECPFVSQSGNLLSPALLKSGKTTKYLIENGILDDKVLNNEGENALHIAIRMGDLSIVKMLVEEADFNINMYSKEGKSPLYLAATLGKTDILRYIVDECHTDIKYQVYNTIYNSESNTKEEVLGILSRISLNRPVVSKPTKSYNCDYDAIWDNNIDYFKYMVETEHKVVYDNLFRVAVEAGKLDLVKYFTFVGVYADFRYKNDFRTPLFSAVEKGHWDIFKYLIEVCGVETHVRDKEGCIPLTVATAFDNLEMTTYLVEQCGADPFEKNKIGNTPFRFAEIKNSKRVYEYLCKIKGIQVPNPTN